LVGAVDGEERAFNKGGAEDTEVFLDSLGFAVCSFAASPVISLVFF
jgi:hypothetical protein